METNVGQILDYGGASRLIGVPKGTLYSWVSKKIIPHIRLGGRLVRFNADELETWLENHQVKPVTEGRLP